MTENPGHIDLEDLKARIENLAGRIRIEDGLEKKKVCFQEVKDDLICLIQQFREVKKWGPTPGGGFIGIDLWLSNNGFESVGLIDILKKVEPNHPKLPQKRAKKEKEYKIHTACPTDMARTPIFYPMAKQEMKKWPYLQRELIDTSWGQTYFSGPKLCIWDEMVFLSIMHLLHDKNSHVFRKVDIVIREEIDGVIVEHEPQNTFRFDGCASDLLRPIFSHKSNYSAGAIEQLSDSLKRFQTSTFIHHPSQKVDDLNYHCYNIIHGLSSRKSRQGREVGIQFSMDPFIAERQKLMTHLDLFVFATIRGKYADFGRAIYRFISSHRDKKWVGHFEKICPALLIDPTLSTKEKRKRIKGAIERLVEVKVLKHGQSKLMSNGQLHLVAK